MVHYCLNKIKLGFDVQYNTVILTLLTYLLSGFGLGLENADLEPIPSMENESCKSSELKRWTVREICCNKN